MPFLFLFLFMPSLVFYFLKARTPPSISHGVAASLGLGSAWERHTPCRIPWSIAIPAQTSTCCLWPHSSGSWLCPSWGPHLQPLLHFPPISCLPRLASDASAIPSACCYLLLLPPQLTAHVGDSLQPKDHKVYESQTDLWWNKPKGQLNTSPLSCTHSIITCPNIG